MPFQSNRPPRPRAAESETSRPKLELPSNATAIRADISDNFSCENRIYGYYADVENECQIFHVCLPVMNQDERRERSFRWSFICPEETYFSQKAFTCVRMEDMFNDCKDSEQYYELNKSFGGSMDSNDTSTDSEMAKEPELDQKPAASEMMQMVEKIEATTEGKKLPEKQEMVMMDINKSPLFDSNYNEAEVIEVNNELDEAADEPNSHIKVIINAMEMMPEALLPKNPEVYRDGVEEKEAIVPVMKTEVTEDELPLDPVQEMDDVRAEEEEKPVENKQPLTIMETKEDVIKSVENIIQNIEKMEKIAPETATKEQAMDQMELRRIPDPRRRRFVFKADARH